MGIFQNNMATFDLKTVADINVVAKFLSDAQVEDLSSVPPVDCIVLCASAVLYGAEQVFDALSRRPSITKCLVLCGGIGHSTLLMYGAIKRHPRYSKIAQNVRNLPEARMLEKILDEFYSRAKITREGCTILLEDQSTNCGQNASCSRNVLDQAGFQAIKTCTIVQDPTMMRRTRASFEKVYEDASSPVSFLSCPVFVPEVRLSCESLLEYDTLVEPSGLWDQTRFLELIMGEIPRLRDDESGYGPEGKGFIAYVDVPYEVESAWSRLVVRLKTSR